MWCISSDRHHLDFAEEPNDSRASKVGKALDLGAAAIGATICFGFEQSTRQIAEISQAFALAHKMGLATVLWCYLRNSEFKRDKDYHPFRMSISPERLQLREKSSTRTRQSLAVSRRLH